jgi:hypothetical protein
MWHKAAKSLPRLRAALLLALLLVFPLERRAQAYSLMTHEMLIDLTWQDSIVPLLLSRYPNLTPAQLEQARAYAYGGCVIQDIGYYPFGDTTVSNLTHYVRSGDFIVNLFRNATNANELAFAVGALSHYIGDSIGHSEATNLAVPLEFPGLGERYGKVVTYADGKRQHVQTEFAFDIDQVAHHRVAPLRFVRHIGLQVPVRQLALAFYQTYGLSEDFSARRGRRFNVRGYRFAVHTLIPRAAYAITLLHRGSLPADPASPEMADIEKQVAAVSAENHWDTYRRKAGFETYMLAGLFFVLPKVGALKLIDVKGPTADTESEYIHSLAQSLEELRDSLHRFTPPKAGHAPAADAAETDAHSLPPAPHMLPVSLTPAGQTQIRSNDPRHPLPNRDLDTGYVVKPGGYSLTDSTYAGLLHHLAQTPAKPIPPGIKEDILAYYSNPSAPITTKGNASQWAQVQADLAVLAKMPTSTEPQPYPTYGDEAGAKQ